MKVIVIDAWLTYQNTKGRLEGVKAAFSYGYWNVFQYQTALENFLMENKIAYRIKDKADFI